MIKQGWMEIYLICSLLLNLKTTTGLKYVIKLTKESHSLYVFTYNAWLTGNPRLINVTDQHFKIDEVNSSNILVKINVIMGKYLPKLG